MPISVPRNALRTGDDVPGPSTNPTGSPASITVPASTESGRKTPTAGATITRSGTASVSPDRGEARREVGTRDDLRERRGRDGSVGYDPDGTATVTRARYGRMYGRVRAGHREADTFDRMSEPASSPADPVTLLPHRPPFRFVDVVDVVEPGVRTSARYRVTGDEEFLTGHFPGNPVFPGVLQLEALAQAGAIAVLSDARYAGRLPLFGGVEDVRFRRIVRPGDEMCLDVAMERLSARGGWGRGTVTVDGEECCRARLLFALA